MSLFFVFFFFFFNDTATTEIYTLSLHDALPICFQFADALFAEASHYEKLGEFEVKESEEGDKPDVWIPTSDNTKLFHSFGIKPKAWRKGLIRLVKRYYQVAG